MRLNWYLAPHLILSLMLVCGALLVPVADSADAQSIEPQDAPRDATGTGATGGLTIDAGGDASSSAAPVANDAGALAGRVTVRPERTQTPPDIDGRLDDAVWRDAAPHPSRRAVRGE